MKNKKGFTLVELIVVIAISSLLLVAIGLSYSSIFVNRSKAAAKIVYNMLGSAQNVGMSKDNCYFALQSDSNGVITAYILKQDSTGFRVVEEKELSKVSVNVKSTSDTYNIDSTFGIMFEIDRTTGGFKEIKRVMNEQWPSGVSLGVSCTDIIINSSNGGYDIAINSKTGKFFYK